METNEIQTFDPVLFSAAENEFLLETLGLPAVVALSRLKAPTNPNAVRPILQRVNELQELEKHEGLKWVGVNALKDAIGIWLRTNAAWATSAKRSRRAPRWPSLYSYDAKGRAHLAGPGSDSGRVRTYFDSKGGRVPFEVLLIPDTREEWVPPTMVEEVSDPLMFIDNDANRIECRVKTLNGICGHTESFKADSRTSYAAARARFSKHLRKATEEVEAHRTLHTNEFGN